MSIDERAMLISIGVTVLVIVALLGAYREGQRSPQTQGANPIDIAILLAILTLIASLAATVLIPIALLVLILVAIAKLLKR